MHLLNSQARIIELMAIFLYQVKVSTAMSKTDINLVSETVLKPLFIELYGYTNLENINYIEDNKNYPSIDLGDEIARVSIQITATPTIDKIKHTLKKFSEHRLYEKYDRLIIYILTEKQTKYSSGVINKICQGFDFDVKRDVWDYQSITKEIGNLQIDKLSRIEKILEDNFGEKKRIASTLFITLDKYFYNFLDSNHIFNHTWKLEGRVDTLKSLNEFVTSEEKIAIVFGRGGIGKTKLLYEFVKTFKDPNVQIFFLADIPINFETADTLPLRPCVLILDDAHRKEEDLKILIELIHNRARNANPEIKLILASRPHGIKSLERQLNNSGIEYLQINELNELKLAEMKSLARQSLGQNYAYFDEWLADIASDSPLVTVVGGHLLAEKKIVPTQLEQNKEFQQKVLNRFEDVLLGEVTSHINSDTCKKLLSLISAVSPIHDVKEEDFKQAASEFLNLDKSDLVRHIGTLEKVGVLLRRGDGLRITPDVLSDHILHKACLTEQEDPTGYGKQVFDRFRQIYPAQLLSNLAELDWRIQSKSGQQSDLMRDIWQKIREEFQAESHYGRYQLLEILEDTAYHQPEQTLDLVQFAIRNPAKTLANDNSFSLDTHEVVLKKAAKLLHNIGYIMEYLPSCCDILWDLAQQRIKENWSHDLEHPAKILIKLAQYDSYKPFEFNQIVLNSVTRWFKNSKSPDQIFILLDIVDQFLEKDFDANYIEDWTAHFRKFSVPSQETQNIRKQSLDFIDSCLNSEDIRVIVRALESIRKALENRTRQSSESFYKEWESEQAKTIEIINQLVSHNENPLLQVIVIQILRMCAYHSCVSNVKAKAEAIINSIQETFELQLAMVLLQKYDWTHSRYIEFFKEMPMVVANAFLQKYPNTIDGIQFLTKKLKEIQECNFPSFQLSDPDLLGSVYYLLEAIADSNAKYAASMCEILIQQSDLHLLLSSQITPLISKIKLDNPNLASALMQQALDKEDFHLSIAVSRTYFVRGWITQIRDEDLDFIKRLLNHINIKIRATAIIALRELSIAQPQTALNFALAVNLEDSPILARNLCQLFTIRDSINPNILTDDHLKILLSKIEYITNIDDHWIQEFLGYASKRVPNLVVQMFLNRIENCTGDFNKEEYKPLPYEKLKYTFSLSEDNNTKDIIRGIRDISLRKPQTVNYWLSKLFKVVLTSAPTLSLSVLNEWVYSKDSEKIKSVSLLLGSISQSFALTQVEFLANLLEQADIIGQQCFESVYETLCIAIRTTGVRGGALGEPSKENVTLQKESLAIASQFLIGSPTHKFYSSLAKYAESSISRQVALGKSEID